MEASSLPQFPCDVDPAEMVRQIRKLNKLVHKSDDSVFASFVRLTPELALILAAAITLKPFINEKTASVKDAMKAADMLLLQHFFEARKDELRISDTEIHQLMHMAAIFSVIGYRMEKDLSKKSVRILEGILSDEDVRTAVKCNVYQGTTWYNKEMMQMLIVLSALSADIFIEKKGRFRSERYIAQLLEKENKAEYKLDNLLSEKK